jgi:hypothetical protein
VASDGNWLAYVLPSGHFGGLNGASAPRSSQGAPEADVPEEELMTDVSLLVRESSVPRWDTAWRVRLCQ